MTIFPTDASGTEFDPVVHNLLGNAKPQFSQKGNFVKLRPGDKNSQEVINSFLDGLIGTVDDDALAALAGEDSPETSETACPDETPEITIDAPDENPDSVDISIDDGFEDELSDEELASDEIIIEDAPEEDDVDDIIVVDSHVAPQNEVFSNYKGELTAALILEIQNQARASETRADFSKGYQLPGINLAGKDLRASIFSRCNLDGANFEGANLMGANFTEASVKGANFKGACLKFAILPSNFKDECLIDRETNFKGAQQ